MPWFERQTGWPHSAILVTKFCLKRKLKCLNFRLLKFAAAAAASSHFLSIKTLLTLQESVSIEELGYILFRVICHNEDLIGVVLHSSRLSGPLITAFEHDPLGAVASRTRPLAPFTWSLHPQQVSSCASHCTSKTWRLSSRPSSISPHPAMPKYGQHMKLEQIKAMLRPTNAAINGVLGWLESEGVPNSDLLHESDWIHFNITVARAEKMLDTKFAWYRNDINGAVRLRTLGYSVPKKLWKHIDMIQPTTRFGQMRAQRSTVIDFGFVKESNRLSASMATESTGSFNLSACNATLEPRAPQVKFRLPSDEFLAVQRSPSY